MISTNGKWRSVIHRSENDTLSSSLWVFLLLLFFSIRSILPIVVRQHAHTKLYGRGDSLLILYAVCSQVSNTRIYVKVVTMAELDSKGIRDERERDTHRAR